MTPKTNSESGSVSPQDGYIALISAVIISLVLITITFVMSFTGFFARSNILDAEYKARSLSSAEACGDTAILRLANNATYAPSSPEIVDVGPDQCEILSAVHNAGQVTITTHAEFQNAHTYLEIIVTPGADDIEVDSWKELPTP